MIEGVAEITPDSEGKGGIVDVRDGRFLPRLLGCIPS